MIILHLIRSYGSLRPGGAEISLYNLAKRNTMLLKNINIIYSDIGIWEFSLFENKVKIEKKKKYKYIIKNLLNFEIFRIKNIHVHSNGILIFYGYFLALLLKSRLIIKVTRVGEKSLFNRDKENEFDLKLLLKKFFLILICKSKFVYFQILTKTVDTFTSKLTKNIILFPNLIKEIKYDKNLKRKNSFLISSRIIKRKNINLALDQLITLKNFEKYTVNIVGEGSELKYLKHKYDNFNNIHFKGQINHESINYFYEISEYFINLSFSEGMSNSLLEAMSHGCKCIVSDIPENRETGEDFCIYFDENFHFEEFINRSKNLISEKISNFANKKYSMNSINLNKLKELYIL